MCERDKKIEFTIFCTPGETHMLHNQHVEMYLLGKARPICATERVRVTADSRVELATRTRVVAGPCADVL